MIFLERNLRNLKYNFFIVNESIINFISAITYSEIKLKTYQTNIQTLLNILKNFDFSSNDIASIRIYNALSCLIGASLGDSMGSYCEFHPPNKNNKDLIWKKINPIFRTYQGQLTDDTEMAISLGLGILENIKNNKFENYESLNIDPISFYYLFWCGSKPFDIGNATYSALNIPKSKEILNGDVYKNKASGVIQSQARGYNNESLSNGFLMRHTPWSVFVYFLFEFNDDTNDSNENFPLKKNIQEKNYENIIECLSMLIDQEIKLTHPKIDCKYAAIIYDFLILSILTDKNTKGLETADHTKYLDLIKDFFEFFSISNHKQKSHSWMYYARDLDPLHKNFKLIYSAENFVQAQNLDIIKNIGKESIGFYMHAMNLIFFVLKYLDEFRKPNPEEIYRNIIDFICNLGGDTDTNCCIVGGVVGALIGLNNIEFKYIESQLNFNTFQDENHSRPFIYSPGILSFYGLKLYSLLEKSTSQDFNSENK